MCEMHFYFYVHLLHVEEIKHVLNQIWKWLILVIPDCISRDIYCFRLIFKMANIVLTVFDFGNKQPICEFNAIYHAT